jgi:large subunit ribosomal protein L25
MEPQVIHASARTPAGKGDSRKMRAAGRIPAVAYRRAGEAVSLSVDPDELNRLRVKAALGWNSPLHIEVEGGKAIPLALLSDVQRHPVSGALLHVDFVIVDASDEVTVRVPVQVEGRSAGETVGGRIDILAREVALRCKPEQIPQRVLIDVTPMEIGDKVMMQKLPLPAGVRVATDRDTPVVSCVGKKVKGKG